MKRDSIFNVRSGTFSHDNPLSLLIAKEEAEVRRERRRMERKEAEAKLDLRFRP